MRHSGGKRREASSGRGYRVVCGETPIPCSEKRATYRFRRAARAAFRGAGRDGENILILAFVVIVIAASARSAARWSARLLGIVDTIGGPSADAVRHLLQPRVAKRCRPGHRLGDDLPPHAVVLISGRRPVSRARMKQHSGVHCSPRLSLVMSQMDNLFYVSFASRVIIYAIAAPA